MATNINFDDSYVKRIIHHFTDEPFPSKTQGSSLRPLLPEEAEFHLASIYDNQINFSEHNIFVEALQKLIENLLECIIGFDTTYKEPDIIGALSLEKVLSQMFLVGHQACENRLKGKWKNDGTNKNTKNIQEAMELYKNLSVSILERRHQIENSDQKYAQPIEIKKIIKHEPEIIELSDDEEPEPEKKIKLEPSEPTSKKLKLELEPTSSITEGCQSEKIPEETKKYPFVITIRPKYTIIPKVSCLTYETGVKVGYSDAGKKPILIVYDPKLGENVYTFRCMIKGSYRCSSCGLLNVHRYAKLYKGILYSNIHECKGKPKFVVEQEQRLRANRFGHQKLPSLIELSSNEDPRPYPALPKQRPVTRPSNPNFWEDLVEYPDYEECLTSCPGYTGYVAIDNINPNICYEYVPSSRGSFRCSSCLRLKKHTIAKVDFSRNILQSAAHICHGISKIEMESLQTTRRAKLESIEDIEAQLIDFLKLAKFISDNALAILSITFTNGIVINIVAEFCLISFGDYLSLGKITFILWTVLSAMMMIISVDKPSIFTSLMNETIDTIYLDHGIWRECPDNNVKQVARNIVDRLHNFNYCAKGVSSAKAGVMGFNLIFIFLPFISAILSAYKVLPSYIHH